jgi:hypothetical protein
MLRTYRSFLYTLWWRWEKDDQFFFIFPSNGAPVEWNWQGKIEVLGEKPVSVPVPLCPKQIPYRLTRDRTRSPAVGRRWLTVWAMARPVFLPYVPENSPAKFRNTVHSCNRQGMATAKLTSQRSGRAITFSKNIYCFRSRAVASVSRDVFETLTEDWWRLRSTSPLRMLPLHQRPSN